MGLITDLVKAGVFSKDSKPAVFRMSNLKHEDRERLIKKGFLVVASRIDFRIYQLFNKAGSVSLKELPIHLRDTGIMCDKSVDQMISLFHVHSVYDISLVEGGDVLWPKSI